MLYWYLHITYSLIALDIKQNNFLQTLESWGPEYKVEFSIRIMNVPNGDKEYNILHMTDNQNHYQHLLVSVKNGSLHISSTDEKFIFNYPYKTGIEYKVTIEQNISTQNNEHGEKQLNYKNILLIVWEKP